MATTTLNKKQTKAVKELRLTDEPIDKALAARVKEKLITARVSLLLKKPFFGNLATRLILTPADSWCPTAATDGRYFYYNHKFVDMLRVKEVEFLFGHEVLHCVYDHMGRRNNRDPQLWNIADDYAVNYDLVESNIGEMITTVPCLYDRKYGGKSAEEIYDELYEKAEKIDIQGLIEQMLDDHMDGEGEGQGDGDEDSDKEGKGGRPKLSAEERKAIRDEFREALINAVNGAGAGEVPAGVKRIVGELTAPKMNWRELLRLQLESTLQSDYSWLRLSRKGWDTDAIMPGMVNDMMIDICVAIDMSGSISNEMAKDMLGEVQGIMSQFNEFRIHVWCFDTEVYNSQVFTSDNIDDIKDYQPMGGGGTDFEANWVWMKDNDVQPKRFVMFTDGYPCGGWGDEDYCDTVFIIHGTKEIVPPFGAHAYYDFAHETA